MSWIEIINRQVAYRNIAEIRPAEHVFHASRLAQNRLLKLQLSLQSLRSENDALDKKNTKLTEQLRSLEVASAGAISRAARGEQLEAKVVELQEKLQESLKNEKDYYKNECDVKRLTDENTKLKEELAGLRARDAEREELLLRLGSNYKALEEESKLVRPKLVAATTERDRCVRELITAKETIADMQGKILEYEEKLNTILKETCGGVATAELSRSKQKKEPLNSTRQAFSEEESTIIPSSVTFTIDRPHGDRPIYAVCAMECANSIVTAGADKMIRYWDAGSGTANRSHTSVDVPMCISSSCGHLIAGCTDGTIRIWGVDTQRRTELTGHREKVIAAYFSGDARTAYTASSDRTIRLWDVQAGVSRRTLLNPSSCNDLCVAESLILSAHYNGSICMWDSRVQSGSPEEIKGVHPGGATCVRLASYNSLCISHGRAGTISVRDPRCMGKELFRVERGDLSTPTHLARFAVSPSGKFCAVGSTRGSVLIVNLTDRCVVDAELQVGHREYVKSVAWAQKGDTSILATIGDDKRLVLWS